jgi:predicted dienelactone hydrolase
MLRKVLTQLVVLIGIAVLTIHVSPAAAQTPAPTFPLADRGAYAVGIRTMDFTDTSRDKRQMHDYVWYPAIPPANATKSQQYTGSQFGWGKAPPDMKAAPYPLILISPGWTQDAIDFKALAISLVSHGYVVLGLQHPDEYSQLQFINRPMDILFTIKQLAAINQGDLSGMIDTDHVGIFGDSYGAYTSLALTGARIDPVAASTVTAKPYQTVPFGDTDPRTEIPDWNWDTIISYYSKFASLTKDELWPPITDKRIKAAIMESPCYAQYFGEKGLATASVPSLIFAGTKDDICPYQPDDTYIDAHLGSPDHYLLSIINGGHVPGFDDKTLPFTTQVMTAFYDYYLKGQKDDAQYLTEKYVDDIEAQLKLGLVWGEYKGQ